MNTKIQKQDLKKFYECENGSISILGLIITAFIISAMATVYKKMINENEQTRIRLNTYLCFKYGLKKIKKSHRTIFYANKSLTLLNIAKLTNPGPHIEAARKIIQTTQYLSYLSYVQSILKKKECHLWNKKALLKKFPYLLTGFKTLKRSSTGHAQRNKKKGYLKLVSSKMLRNSFLLIARYNFTPLLALKDTKEVSLFKMTQAL